MFGHNALSVLQKILSETPLQHEVTSKRRNDKGIYALRPKAVSNANNLSKGESVYLSNVLNCWIKHVEHSKLVDNVKRRLSLCARTITRVSSNRLCGHRLCVFCRSILIDDVLSKLKTRCTFPCGVRQDIRTVTKNKPACASPILTTRNISPDEGDPEGGFLRYTLFFTKTPANKKGYIDVYDETDAKELLTTYLHIDINLLHSEKLEQWLSLTKGMRLFDFSKVKD